MASHLMLRLEAPLMSFGDTMIDASGPTRDLPNVSSIAGLIANALGLERGDKSALQRLQDRLVMGARLDRVGTELRDFQTAQLAKSDEGWTTLGRPEGRAGGANSYLSPHIRERYYRADAQVTVALRLDPDDKTPNLANMRAALDEPARPLFIGRKPCLPSGPLLAGAIEAETVLAALQRWPLAMTVRPEAQIEIVVPGAENPQGLAHRRLRLTDRRNWMSDVHAGESDLHVIRIAASAFERAAGVDA